MTHAHTHTKLLPGHDPLVTQINITNVEGHFALLIHVYKIVISIHKYYFYFQIMYVKPWKIKSNMTRLWLELELKPIPVSGIR